MKTRGTKKISHIFSTQKSILKKTPAEDKSLTSYPEFSPDICDFLSSKTTELSNAETRLRKGIEQVESNKSQEKAENGLDRIEMAGPSGFGKEISNGSSDDNDSDDYDMDWENESDTESTEEIHDDDDYEPGKVEPKRRKSWKNLIRFGKTGEKNECRFCPVSKPKNDLISLHKHIIAKHKAEYDKDIRLKRDNSHIILNYQDPTRKSGFCKICKLDFLNIAGHTTDVHTGSKENTKIIKEMTKNCTTIIKNISTKVTHMCLSLEVIGEISKNQRKHLKIIITIIFKNKKTKEIKVYIGFSRILDYMYASKKYINNMKSAVEFRKMKESLLKLKNERENPDSDIYKLANFNRGMKGCKIREILFDKDYELVEYYNSEIIIQGEKEATMAKFAFRNMLRNSNKLHVAFDPEDSKYHLNEKTNKFLQDKGQKLLNHISTNFEILDD